MLEPAQRSGHPEFYKLLDSLAELHSRKSRDYGAKTDPFANFRAFESWGIPAWTAPLLRIEEKLARLRSLANNGQLQNESADDSLRDIAVLSLISLILLRETDVDSSARAPIKSKGSAARNARRSQRSPHPVSRSRRRAT